MIPPVRYYRIRYPPSCTCFIALLLWICSVLLLATTTAAVTTTTTTTTATEEDVNILSREQIDTYHQDGYIYVKGLLSSDLMNELTNAVQDVALSKKKHKQSPGGYFSLLQSNNIFLPSSSTTTTSSPALHNNNNNQTNQIYRKVVIDSILPKVVAELMQLNRSSNSGDNVRCLRDITMVRDVHETKTCGWHVDDIGFWPISYHHTLGVNVWIALDDMKYRGNMALAPKSHVASWRHDAYTTIGQNRTREGGPTQEQLREAQQSKLTHYLTCDMHLVNETLSNHIESTAVYIDNVERGDIIFSSRLLFHRTMPVTPEGIQYYTNQENMTNEPQHLKRYSIRYEPGTAQINSGWNVEWSVLHDLHNAGRSLNDIAKLHPEYAFYPQVWPTTDRIDAMDHVAQHAEQWTKQAKQLVYDTLFSSSTTTTTLSDNQYEEIIEID